MEAYCKDVHPDSEEYSGLAGSQKQETENVASGVFMLRNLLRAVTCQSEPTVPAFCNCGNEGRPPGGGLRLILRVLQFAHAGYLEGGISSTAFYLAM